MEPVRLPLPQESSARSADRMKGPWGVNTLNEGRRALKRPGLADGFAGVEGTTGQGVFNFDGQVVQVVDDVLYTGLTPTAAWNSSASYSTDAEVSYEGELWIATQSSVGQVPADGSVFWSLVSVANVWHQAASNIGIPVGADSFNAWRLAGYGGALWIILGTSSIYKSLDGVTWVLQTTNLGSILGAGPVARLLSFGGFLWLLQSFLGAGKVYKTSNGTTWTAVTVSSAPSDAIFNYTVWNGEVWIYRQSSSDVWSSPDLVTWTQKAISPATVDGNTQIIGDASFLYLVQQGVAIYRSSDGVSWSLFTPATIPPTRASFRCLYYQGKVWMLGGSAPYSYEVWSFDGSNWAQVAGVSWGPPGNGFNSTRPATTLADIPWLLLSGSPSVNFPASWYETFGLPAPSGLPL
jgi:hypothetical protein